MREFEFESPFCGNPDCVLHVRAGMAGVMGHGNWAQLQNGQLIGRSLYCGLFLCDECFRDWRAVAAFMPDGERLHAR